ncbi:MAG: zinc D-Ala-D-Ala carboxypeptidase [Candidatus Parcubacteria bacterium]|jgi:LAS superfamily LD-carboxypeptidase LdcB|nr:zinc D-Ala-D-Ala carboxypeptidase [Candidatus Parcubacteria bacterium]
MKQISREQKPLFWGSAIIAVVLIAVGIYSVVRISLLSARINALSAEIAALSTNLASTTESLRAAIDQTRNSLSSDLSAQKQNVGAIQQQLGGVQNQVGGLSGTLTTLQKLSKTDPELLKKYSKVYFLNENYVPARLSEISPVYVYSDTKRILILTDVLAHLNAMMKAASSTGTALYVQSGYRSFDEQKALKGDYAMTFGAGTANSFSADQGYSEHQLGTAVDMITTGMGGVLDEKFDQTAAYGWLRDNAYKYGFALSYPKNNGYYVYEPWHWRFVGIKLSTHLRDLGQNFYDLDQREIDTYLADIFD